MELNGEDAHGLMEEIAYNKVLEERIELGVAGQLGIRADGRGCYHGRCWWRDLQHGAWLWCQALGRWRTRGWPSCHGDRRNKRRRQRRDACRVYHGDGEVVGVVGHGGCRELTGALLELLGQPRRRPAMGCSRWTVEKEHGLARDDGDAAWPREDVASSAHAEKKGRGEQDGIILGFNVVVRIRIN